MIVRKAITPIGAKYFCHLSVSKIFASFLKAQASNIDTASFAISEGWNCKGPNASQRFAPLTVTPNGVKSINKSNTTTIQANFTAKPSSFL